MPAIHFPKPNAIRPSFPAINWAHPLLSACELLAVAGPAVLGAKDQRYGVFPTMGGTVDVTLTQFKELGFTAGFNAQGDKLEYAGKPTNSFRNVTLLWIGKLRANPAALGLLVSTSNADTGYNIGISTAGVFQFVVGGFGVLLSTITPSLNAPYLLAASRNEAGNLDFFTRRLDTGQVIIGSRTGATNPTNGSGIYTVGDWLNSGGIRSNNDTALALVTKRYYPAQTLNALTRDLSGLFIQQSGPLRFWEAPAPAGAGWGPLLDRGRNRLVASL